MFLECILGKIQIPKHVEDMYKIESNTFFFFLIMPNTKNEMFSNLKCSFLFVFEKNYEDRCLKASKFLFVIYFILNELI